MAAVCGEFDVIAAVVVVDVAADPELGVARGCTDLPRLGSSSCPPCSPCQVGAERKVPDETAQQTVEKAVCFAGIWDLWAELGVFRRFRAGGMGQGYPRLAPSRWAGVRQTPGADATVAGGCLPALGTRWREDRFSVPTVACSARSSVSLLPRPCIPSRQLQCDCAATVSCSRGCMQEERVRAGRGRYSAIRGLFETRAKGRVVAGCSGRAGRGRDVRSAYCLHFAKRTVHCAGPV